jgi:hypothetical protein
MDRRTKHRGRSVLFAVAVVVAVTGAMGNMPVATAGGVPHRALNPSSRAVYHGQWFHTPTNNIRCDADATHVECWVMSTAARSCAPHLPHAWLLKPRGRVWTGVPCDGPGVGPALRYGSMWSRGVLRCRSQFIGLKCWSLLSGHGFFLSRKSQRRF